MKQRCVFLYECNLSALQRTYEMPFDFIEQAACDTILKSLLSVLAQDQLSGSNNRSNILVGPALRHNNKRDRVHRYACAGRRGVDGGSDAYEPYRIHVTVTCR